MADLNVVKSKVQGYLAASFTAELTDRGGFSLRHESARLFIDFKQRNDQDDAPVYISFLCPLLFGLQPSPELYEHVALHADDYLFGHLSAFKNDDGSVTLFFSHHILGDFLDEEELKSAIYMVLSTANDLDDELQQRFGGTRFHDDD